MAKDITKTYLILFVEKDFDLKSSPQGDDMFLNPLFSVALLVSSSWVSAQTSAASLNVNTKKVEAPKPAAGTDKTDQLITNRNLRSVNGSLSTWSFASTWNYQGGDINKPIGSSRPNVTGSQDVALVQNLSGTVGISYRLTQVDRLTLGMGVQMASPFSSSPDSKFSANGRREFERTQGKPDAANPQLAYRRIMKPLGVQSILTATSTYYTQDALVDRGLESKNEVSLNSLYDFGGSKFSAGLVVQGGFFTHNKDDLKLRGVQPQYEFYALPITEFEINDFMNWRAVYRYYWYQQNRAQKSSEWTTLDPTISTGIGFSVTRDIFLYPNIQFNPENIRADRTNVGFSANINLF
jgi:hypothetical protein